MDYWIAKAAKEEGIKPTCLPFIKKLTRHYSNQFDINFYFPIGAIPLVGDDMRAVDMEFQSDIDRIIQKKLEVFKPKNLVEIEGHTQDQRCQEMLEWISIHSGIK